MNCMALEQDDGILIIDCGTTFPSDDRGVDVIHPDFTWLHQHAERVSGVFLTHGHEDHIGGLPYLLRGLKVPVYGPPHALASAWRRLDEHGYRNDQLELKRADVGTTYSLGPFDVEPIRMSHSIVEATALRIETAAGTVVHSGDFNFDPEPSDGEPTDVERLRAIGDEGVSLLLSDSTNIDVTAPPTSERQVRESLSKLVRTAEQRVVVALFASNIQRLITLGDLAQQSGRRICLLGRSLQTQRRIGHDIGRLQWPSDLVIGPEQAQSYPRDELMVLVGGTQAERRSSLRRLSLGQHHQLRLEAGDRVIMSSRTIPGNEPGVFDMYNDLLRMGIDLRTRFSDPLVHTSGHAHRSEQRRLLELIQPRCFIPEHGTLHHLRRHAALAEECGVPHTLVIENGDVAILEDDRLRPGGGVSAGRVHVAWGGAEASPDVLKQRAEVGRSGLVMVSAAHAEGRLVSDLVVTCTGVPTLSDEAASHKLASAISDELARLTKGKRARDLRSQSPEVSLSRLNSALEKSTRRAVDRASGERPKICVHLVSV